MRHKTHRLRFMLLWLLTVILTVVLFVFTAFGFIFHVLYSRGGEMFASDLLSHSFTKWIPPIYYSGDKLAEIKSMSESGEPFEETAPDAGETPEVADGDE